MSVKNANAVSEYTTAVVAMQAALANLMEFAESLPAPVDEQLPNLHYGHLGAIKEMTVKLCELSEIADRFGSM